MRTLVISDLHLGSRGGRDVLRRPAPLDALLGALRRVDRLVLLGDVVELLEGRVEAALADAAPVLEQLGGAMEGGEIVVIPGNHDHLLIRAWVRERRDSHQPLGAATRVPHDATPPLALVTDALRPAGGRLRVHYPGAWLGRHVYAHHGHYITARLAGGRLARIGRAAGEELDTAADRYERARSPSFAAASLVVRDLPDTVEDQIDRVAGFARAFGKALIFSGDPDGARAGRWAPVGADLLDRRLTRAGLAAVAGVADDLGALPRAHHVIFGHVHRLGPLDGDDRDGWRPLDPGPRLWNSGSWVHEPFLVSATETDSPYWPGGGILVDGEHEPRVVRMLEGVAPADIVPPAPPAQAPREEEDEPDSEGADPDATGA